MGSESQAHLNPDYDPDFTPEYKLPELPTADRLRMLIALEEIGATEEELKAAAKDLGIDLNGPQNS